MEPHYDEVLGAMGVALLCRVSHCVGVKGQGSIGSWDRQGGRLVGGFCDIRPLYDEVPLFCTC